LKTDFRVKFPKEYILFIRKYNGAVPVKNEITIEKRVYSIERFLCILEDYQSDEINGWYDIGVTEAQIGERLSDNEDLVGADMIPIAALFAGDFVCLDYRKNSTVPEVCIWFHEESREFAPVTEKIANNFEEFIHMLE